MKTTDVPQQGGLNAGCREINYAVGSDGRYTLASSVGWEAKNIALRQAWEAIVEQLRGVLIEIKAGKMSPLAYYMVKEQMDPGLLAQYSGVSRWRVKRHLKPAVFARLEDSTLIVYAELFRISVAQLRSVPAEPDLRLAELEQPKGEAAR